MTSFKRTLSAHRGAICLAALSAVFLAGCGQSVSSLDYPVPEELKDCAFYKLTNGADAIKVVRCPNSTTSVTYRDGKHDQTSVVIDGTAPNVSLAAPAHAAAAKPASH
jgi:hypothetical protein